LLHERLCSWTAWTQHLAVHEDFTQQRLELRYKLVTSGRLDACSVGAKLQRPTMGDDTWLCRHQRPVDMVEQEFLERFHTRPSVVPQSILRSNRHINEY